MGIINIVATRASDMVRLEHTTLDQYMSGIKPASVNTLPGLPAVRFEERGVEMQTMDVDEAVDSLMETVGAVRNHHERRITLGEHMFANLRGNALVEEQRNFREYIART